jgi:hypothetical protein
MSKCNNILVMNDQTEKKDSKSQTVIPAERKNTEEQPPKAGLPKGEKRTEYPGFYMIEGEFLKE